MLSLNNSIASIYQFKIIYLAIYIQSISLIHIIHNFYHESRIIYRITIAAHMRLKDKILKFK